MESKKIFFGLLVLVLLAAYVILSTSSDNSDFDELTASVERLRAESVSAKDAGLLESRVQESIKKASDLAQEANPSNEFVENDEDFFIIFNDVLELTPKEKAGLVEKYHSMEDLERMPGFGGEPRFEDIFGRERYIKFLKFDFSERRVSTLIRELNLTQEEGDELRIAYWESRHDSLFYLQGFEGNPMLTGNERFLGFLNKRLEGKLELEARDALLFRESARITEDIILDPRMYGFSDRELVSEKKENPAWVKKLGFPKSGDVDEEWLEKYAGGLEEESAKRGLNVGIFVFMEGLKQWRDDEFRKVEIENLEEFRKEIRERRKEAAID